VPKVLLSGESDATTLQEKEDFMQAFRDAAEDVLSSKIDIQDHKAIMNKVASLPWFLHKQDTSIYKKRQGEKKTHYTCVQRLSRAIQNGVENHLVLISSRTEIKPIQLMFSNRVSIPTHKETRKTEPWIPKG
jgi:hypothetical protein